MRLAASAPVRRALQRHQTRAEPLETPG